MLSVWADSRLAVASEEEAWDELDAVLPLPEVPAEEAAVLLELCETEALAEVLELCEDEAVSPVLPDVL